MTAIITVHAFDCPYMESSWNNIKLTGERFPTKDSCIILTQYSCESSKQSLVSDLISYTDAKINKETFAIDPGDELRFASDDGSMRSMAPTSRLELLCLRR